jgi:hypothetical protein
MKYMSGIVLKSLKRIAILQLVILLSIANKSTAQTPVTAVTTYFLPTNSGASYTDDAFSTLSGHSYNYTYGNQSNTVDHDQALSNLTAGGVTYNFLSVNSLVVKMRRVDNPVVKGIRQLKFDEGVINGVAKVVIGGTYDDNMEHFFTSNTNFNSGSDNIFTNQGDGNGNNNNIERVDAIIPGGLQAPDNGKIGLAIFERGNTNQHDPVKVAAILGVDASNNPTSYSSIITLTSASYGTTDAVAAKNYVIERRDILTSTHLLASTSVSQNFGGVFIKYSDFGISNGTIIYGYSVIPNDFKGSTSADIINYTDSTLYPTNTSAADGGIDLVAFTGTLQSGSYTVLPVSLKSFTAITDNLKVNLKWVVENEIDFPTFEVQKSLDGVNFNSIANLSPSANPSGTSAFSYIDDISSDATKSTLYYRIRFIHKDEGDSYSPVRVIVKKAINNAPVSITTYPNPVVNNFSVVIPVQWQNKDLQYSLVSQDGRMILLHKVSNAGSKFQVNVGGLLPGIYTLHLSCGTDAIDNKIVKE